MNKDDMSISGAKVDPHWRWHYRALMRLNGRLIDHIDIVRTGKVRRSKLYYLRALKGKAARLKERT